MTCVCKVCDTVQTKVCYLVIKYKSHGTLFNIRSSLDRVDLGGAYDCRGLVSLFVRLARGWALGEKSALSLANLK